MLKLSTYELSNLLATMTIENQESKQEGGASAKEELAALERTYAELEFVGNSLTKGMEGSLNTARTRAYGTDQVYQKKSSAFIESAAEEDRVLSEDERNELAQAASSRDEARAFQETLEADHPIDERTDRLKDESSPFAEKLKSLGVDMDLATGRKERNGFPAGIMDAINERRRELLTGIRERKLDTPGGLEEMTLEAVRQSKAFDKDRIRKLSLDIDGQALGGSMNAQIMYGRNIEPVVRHMPSTYPPAVRENVVRQMVQIAYAESGSGARLDREKLVSDLITLLPEQKPATKAEATSSAEEGVEERREEEATA